MRHAMALFLALFSAFLPGRSVAEEVPFADFEIRYDETPFALAGGTMVWRGKAVIPLKRDTETQAITGSGTFPFSYEARVTGCLATCKATVSMQVAGKAGIGLIDLAVTDKATTASCRASCPGGAGYAYNEHRDVYTDQVKMNPSSSEPLVRKLTTPGPTLYYTLLHDCAPQADTPGPLAVGVKPGPGAWQVEVLTTLTLDDIRSKVPPNPDRVGLTEHKFTGTVEPTIQTQASRSGETCYWVERVEQTMGPIQMWVPGLNWLPGSCEYRAIDAHERRHVGDARSMLNGYSRDWIKAVQNAGLPRAGKPARAASAAAARAAVLARVDAVSAPVIHTWAGKFAASRSRLDSSDEYARIRNQCPRGWRN